MTIEEDFNFGDRVVLKSFHGTTQPPQSVRAGENYWLLIGRKGVVTSGNGIEHLPPHEKGKRVLVQFDESVVQLGLHCHNERPNSLWLFVADLKHE